MRIKLLKLVEAQPAMFRLFTQARPKASLSYRLGMIHREIAPVMEEYDKARRLIMSKYGDLSEDGNSYTFLDADGKIDQAKVDAANVEHAELVAEEVELSIGFIALNDLDRCKLEPPLSPAEMSSLVWLIRVKESEHLTSNTQKE